jgi:hypothetical protein
MRLPGDIYAKLNNYRMKTFICTIACALALGGTAQAQSIRDAVVRQMESYPRSTLKDLYKNFFQDRFGPGHLISDTVAAKNYILSELESTPCLTGEAAEPLGWQHNFYRVSLSAVKSNLVPCGVLLDALIRSAGEAGPVAMEDWRKEWAEIESIIRSMNLALPNCEADSREIGEKLREGRYMGHHSEAFTDAYAPHYRIIGKKIFEEEIRPLLEQ